MVQEKKALKEEKLKQEEKYMWAVVDGIKEKVCFSLLLLYCNHMYTHVQIMTSLLFV